MTRFLAGLAGFTLIVGGVTLPASPAAAATWTFPSASFTMNDVLGSGSFTVHVTNLTLTPGDTATGYVRVDGQSGSGRTDWCSTSIFTGSSAQWSSPSQSNPCTGSIDFSVDPATGVLTATTGFLNMSSIGVLAQGPASGSANAQAPTVVTLQDCAHV